MRSVGVLPTRRYRLVTVGIAVALVLLAVGATVAVVGYRRTAGAAGAVRGYFAALQRGDAASALAYGDVPAGSRGLLTDVALTEQQRTGGIKQVRIRSTEENGNRASVTVRYMLDFPGAPQQVDTTLTLHRRDDEWRLDAVAADTQLTLRRAAQRATLLGTRLPTAPVLLFPGAVPIRFDSPYVQLAAATASVELDAQPTTQVDAEVSAAGRQEALRLVGAGLLSCLSGHGPLTCPLPSRRVVPGSLRGSLASADLGLTVTLTGSAAGVIDVDGTTTVIGTYRRLTFDNREVAGKGRVRLPVDASSYAVRPMRMHWTPAQVFS